MTTPVRVTRRCPECGRVFDMFNETDAAEWADGHDCETRPTMTTANRITTHANRVRAMIRAGGKDGALATPAQLAAFDAKQALTHSEHAAYQNAQAQAFAAGRLSFDEAQTVYMALGETGSESNGGWAAETDTALKVTVTALMGQLLMAARR